MKAALLFLNIVRVSSYVAMPPRAFVVQEPFHQKADVTVEERAVECLEEFGECNIDELQSLQEGLELINDQCFIVLEEFNADCDGPEAQRRDLLKYYLDLQHELQHLDTNINGISNMKKAGKFHDDLESEDHWTSHYVQSYHW